MKISTKYKSKDFLNHFSFVSKPRETIQRLENYLTLYEQFVSDIPITDKNYETTLFRGLIIYYIYKENDIGNKFTTEEIAKAFGFKNHSTIIYSNKRVKYYIEHPNAIASKAKVKFIYLFYRFNQIFTEKCIAGKKKKY